MNNLLAIIGAAMVAGGLWKSASVVAADPPPVKKDSEPAVSITLQSELNILYRAIRDQQAHLEALQKEFQNLGKSVETGQYDALTKEDISTLKNSLSQEINALHAKMEKNIAGLKEVQNSNHIDEHGNRGSVSRSGNSVVGAEPVADETAATSEGGATE